MYMLPLTGRIVEYLSGKPCSDGTLLGLILPTAVRSGMNVFIDLVRIVFRLLLQSKVSE